MNEGAGILLTAESAFETWRGRMGLVLGPVLALAVYLLLSDLSPGQRRLSTVLILVVIFWISEAVPLAVTALLGPSLCVLLGVSDARNTFQHFGNPIIFVFLGGFLIARGMAANGIDRRLALRILRMKSVGNSPERIRIAVGAIAVLLSMWISNTATAAMLLPIVLGIATALTGLFDRLEPAEAARARSYLPGLMLVTAYSCSIGGLATPVGSPPNLIGLGMIEAYTGRSVSFFEWMMLGVPISLAMFAGLTFLIRWLFPAPRTDLRGLSRVLDEMEGTLPPWGAAQKVTVAGFVTAVVLWTAPGLATLIFGGHHAVTEFLRERLQEGPAALIAASVLFFIPVGWKPLRGAIRWEEARHVDWGTIMLFGGGLSLGSLMHSTGLSELLARSLLGGEGGGQLWMMTAVAVLIGTSVTELASNTASASMLVPVVLAISAGAGVSGIPPALGAAIACNLAFMLPVSTPPNAILYGTGKISIVQMVRTGFLLDLLGAAVILGVFWLLLPLAGLL